MWMRLCRTGYVYILQACNLVEQTIEFLDDSRKKDRVCCLCDGVTLYCHFHTTPISQLVYFLVRAWDFLLCYWCQEDFRVGDRIYCMWVIWSSDSWSCRYMIFFSAIRVVMCFLSAWAFAIACQGTLFSCRQLSSLGTWKTVKRCWYSQDEKLRKEICKNGKAWETRLCVMIVMMSYVLLAVAYVLCCYTVSSQKYAHLFSKLLWSKSGERVFAQIFSAYAPSLFTWLSCHKWY